MTRRRESGGRDEEPGIKVNKEGRKKNKKIILEKNVR